MPQFTDDPSRIITAARRAEELGLDSIWVFDHLWPLSGGEERPILEAWTTLAHLAVATETITIGTLVSRSSLRHPAVLAKMAATVADVAPGRLIVGIGSGDHMSRAENESFGLPYWSGEDRVDQLRATVEVVTRFLREEAVTVHGDFVQVNDLMASPRADPTPAVWVAGRSGDALEVAADLGDGWNGWGGTPERFAEDAATLLDLARGRYVEPTWAGLVVLRATDDEARRAADKRQDLAADPAVLVGGPETVAQGLGRFVAAGAKHLVTTFAGTWLPETLELLARAVRPRLAPGVTPGG